MAAWIRNGNFYWNTGQVCSVGECRGVFGAYTRVVLSNGYVIRYRGRVAKELLSDLERVGKFAGVTA